MNIKEANVLAMGMCYPFALEKARKWYDDHVTVDMSGKRPKVIVHPDRDNLDKFKVVHGTVTDKWQDPPKPILHAWVEMGDKVFDDQTKFTKPNGVDKSIYYEVFQPEPKNEYTAKQAIRKCSLKGTEGPWDAKSIAKMKARDAWLGENKMKIKSKLKQIIREELTMMTNEDVPWEFYRDLYKDLYGHSPSEYPSDENLRAEIEALTFIQDTNNEQDKYWTEMDAVEAMPPDAGTETPLPAKFSGMGRRIKENKRNNKMNIKQIIKEELENILREEELEEITVVPPHDDLSKIEKKCDELDRLEDLAFDVTDKLKSGEPNVAVVVKLIAERISVISNEIRVLVGRHRNRMEN